MPRASPTQVIEQRLTLGTYERNKIEEVERLAKRSLTVAGVGAVAMPLAVVGAAGALAVSMTGLGLGDVLDKEAIRNITIGAPSVSRTRRDGSEQVIENPLFGVPLLGPLFGTGMRLGEKTAEATSATVEAIANALDATYDATGIPSPGDTAANFEKAGVDAVNAWAAFMGRLYGYR